MGELMKLNQTNEFGKNYEIICNQKCVSPLSTIQAHLMDNRLEFCCDRVNHEDWSPILNALAADQSLLKIHVYSRNRKKQIFEHVDTEEKLNEYRRCKRTSSRRSIIYTNFLMRCFIDAVAVCARDSKTLTYLSLDGIPLGSLQYLDILCTGLSFNRNLQSISLARSRIGDAGCDRVLRALLENPHLQMIDLTACLLTFKSTHCITSFLKKKRTKLIKNAWNQDTGHKDTNSQQFQGLHTLILDKNRNFGDKGLRPLTETLKDDFWLKSLSLCHCGLTRTSGDAIIDLLEINSVIVSINFKDNRLPVEILKTTRKLLKRRLDKGERISLKRRLINRKKDLRWKLKKGSIGKTGKKQRNHRQISSKRIIAKRRKNEQSSMDNNKKSLNLLELKERLSYIIDCNRKLKRGLTKNKRLLVGEKRSRLNAEKSYQLLTPVIEKLRNGFQKENHVRSRVLLENHLCSDIRKIFGNLENISAFNAINSKILHTGSCNEKIGMEAEDEEIIEKLSISEVGEKIKTFGGVQTRPNCPPRQKFK